jgi:hypothetical protein
MLKLVNLNVENLTFLYNPWRFVLVNKIWVSKIVKT